MCTNAHHRRGGASGNKLKMTLGLPVYVPPFPQHLSIHREIEEKERSLFL